MESNPNLAILLSLLLTATLIAAATTTTNTTGAAINGGDEDQIQPRTQQMENIIDALIGAGDFSNWATLLASADPSILPVTATIFVPSDADYDAVSSSSPHLSPFLLFPYHVIPQRLSFSDLLLFPTNTRLPTLLPGFSLLITNNSRSNFSIDGSNVIHPDLYQNAAVSAHGIAAPFDYTLFGDFDYSAVFGNGTSTHKPDFIAGDSVVVSGDSKDVGFLISGGLVGKILGFVIFWIFELGFDLHHHQFVGFLSSCVLVGKILGLVILWIFGV